MGNLNIKNPEPFGTDLKNLNLSVLGGEIVGLAGVSGNGQQELGRIISGEDLNGDLNLSTIEMFGQPVTRKGVIERLVDSVTSHGHPCPSCVHLSFKVKKIAL